MIVGIFGIKAKKNLKQFERNIIFNEGNIPEVFDNSKVNWVKSENGLGKLYILCIFSKLLPERFSLILFSEGLFALSHALILIFIFSFEEFSNSVPVIMLFLS